MVLQCQATYDGRERLSSHTVPCHWQLRAFTTCHRRCFQHIPTHGTRFLPSHQHPLQARWDLITCILVDGYQCFRVTLCSIPLLLCKWWPQILLMYNVYTSLSYTHFLITPRGELSYLAPLGSEKISAPYFKQCFFREGGITPPRLSQTPRLPVPRQK